jgi:cytochrome bd-type quinol oxidase subunit 1
MIKDPLLVMFGAANLIGALLLLYCQKWLLKKGDDHASAKRLKFFGLFFLVIAILELLFHN